MQSASTCYSSKAGIPAVPKKSSKVLKVLEYKVICKAVAEIAEEQGFGSSIKYAVEDTMTGSVIHEAIQAAVDDALTQGEGFDISVTALNDNEG